MKENIKIISVNNNWDKDILSIDLSIGNVCNYKCWYCWPDSNLGNYKFPNFDLLKKNISHLFDHYLKNSTKKRFSVHFCGGEPSHWPKLLDFSKFLKDEYDCLISMTSNGSKKFDWWIKAAPLFDRIHLSCHHEFIDLENFRNVCDYLYKQNVLVNASVMMDPFAWDKCINIVEYLKKSKHKWTIAYTEIVDHRVNYSKEQKKILSAHRARGSNIFWFLKNNKYYLSKVTAVDDQGKKHKMSDIEILLRRLNNFYGWSCSVGVNWIHISMKGEISGTCGQLLYGEQENFNIFDENFVTKFNPIIQNSVCTKTQCICPPETVMPKFLLETNKKFIPIHIK